MKLLIDIIKNFSRKENKTSLGRWYIDSCNKKINRKIDLSNEDHCGPCGLTIYNKKTSNSKQQNYRLKNYRHFNTKKQILISTNKWYPNKNYESIWGPGWWEPRWWGPGWLGPGWLGPGWWNYNRPI